MEVLVPCLRDAVRQGFQSRALKSVFDRLFYF